MTSTVRARSHPKQRLRARALRVVVGALTFAAPRAVEAHGDEACVSACAVGQAMVVAVPALYGAAALATDVGTLVHLARSGTVSPTWSIAGTIFWIPPTLFAGATVVVFSVLANSNDEATRAAALTPLGVSIGGFALSAGSLALQIYALTRPPPAASTPSGVRARGRVGGASMRWAGFAPWGTSQMGAWATGLTTTFSF